MKTFFKFLIVITIAVAGGIIYVRANRKPSKQYIVIRSPHNIYY